MKLSKNDQEIARIIGDGVAVYGVREALEVYRQLWALGYRPGVPLTFFMRQWAKKKKGPKSLKSLVMAPEYNPKQQGEGSVNHRKAPSTMSSISRQ